MLSPAVQRSLPLVLSLTTLFAAGLALGYRLGSSRQPAPATTRQESSHSADEWASNASLALERDLSLSPSQSALVRSHLTTVSRGIFLERDRALFQIHLRLLEAHDILSKDLTLANTQRSRLKASREKLRALITEKFAPLLKDLPDASPLLKSDSV
jgi:hypothetical protein